MQDSQQCSSNYPDKLIPMAMPMNPNTMGGMGGMGGMGKKKRDAGNTMEDVDEKFMGAENDNDYQSIGRISLAQNIDECGMACIQQIQRLNAIKQVRRVAIEKFGSIDFLSYFFRGSTLFRARNWASVKSVVISVASSR